MSINFCYSCGEKVEGKVRSCANCGCVLRKGVARQSGFGCCFGCIIYFILFVGAIELLDLTGVKTQSNDSVAASNVRSIVGAQIVYHAENGRYAETFDELTSGTPPYLDGSWLLSKKTHMYRLDGDGDSFTVHADPAELGETGSRYFFSDQSGVVRYNTEESASKDDPVR